MNFTDHGTIPKKRPENWTLFLKMFNCSSKNQLCLAELAGIQTVSCLFIVSPSCVLLGLASFTWRVITELHLKPFSHMNSGTTSREVNTAQYVHQGKKRVPAIFI